ncbi:baseplate J/gp47 family protein [Methylobacterium sp. Gmos1]
MALLPIRTFSTLVQGFAAAVQGRARALVDFSVGAVLRAIAEATADLALWLESLIVYVASLTRASTSNGTDLDTWANDFGITRLGATATTGLVTFARFDETSDGLVPLGTTVQTADGSQRFTVVLDAGLLTFNGELGGYVLRAGVKAIAVPVKADIPGAGGNVVAGALNTITSSTPFVDTVRNIQALTSGTDAETDAALRRRIVLFFSSLAKATVPALGYAVTSLQLGLRYAVVENETWDGTVDNGFVYVVVDDGTGFPPDSLIASVRGALGRVRAGGVRLAVFPPEVIYAAISAHVTARPGYDVNAVIGAVDRAIDTYVNGLGLGESLSWGRLYQVAYDASPGVQAVAGLLLDNGQADIPARQRQVIKTQNLQVA